MLPPAQAKHYQFNYKYLACQFIIISHVTGQSDIFSLAQKYLLARENIEDDEEEEEVVNEVQKNKQHTTQTKNNHILLQTHCYNLICKSQSYNIGYSRFHRVSIHLTKSKQKTCTNETLFL